MVLRIKDDKAERLARELVRATGESLTEAVTRALEDRLRRVKVRRGGPTLEKELDEIALRCARLPRRDERTPEDIVGYDDRGVTG